MATELSIIINEYAAFETTVRQQMADICAPHCSVCQSVCCCPQYCRENIDSPFLNLISSKRRTNKVFSTERGWLTSAGCALSAGRPPVCYQFNCNKIINALPDEQHRYIFQVLSNLVPHIGKRALGQQHLVEIMNAGKLNQLTIARFGMRLAEARKAWQIIQSISGKGFPAAPIPADLSKIVPIPQSLAG